MFSLDRYNFLFLHKKSILKTNLFDNDKNNSNTYFISHLRKDSNQKLIKNKEIENKINYNNSHRDSTIMSYKIYK